MTQFSKISFRCSFYWFLVFKALKFPEVGQINTYELKRFLWSLFTSRGSSAIAWFIFYNNFLYWHLLRDYVCPVCGVFPFFPDFCFFSHIINIMLGWQQSGDFQKKSAATKKVFFYRVFSFDHSIKTYFCPHFLKSNVKTF